MKRLLFLIVLALVLAPCAHAAARPVYVTNLSTLPDREVLDALPAFQTAVDEDFGPEWNAGSVELKLTEVVPPHAWSIELVDHPDCWFCAGYHDVVDGAPHSLVGVEGAWSITFTHELFEILADPFINRGMMISPRPGAKPRWYALEVADPVEADRLAYTRKSASGKDVAISDFVTEAWFRRGSSGPWDFARATARPLQILEDGYQLVWSGWTWTWVSRLRQPRA